MANQNGTGAAGVTGGPVDEVSATQHFMLDKSAVRSVSADEMEISKSFVGFAKFEHGTLRQGTAGVVAGRSIAVDEVRTGILISPVVRGDVHTWLDIRSAMAIGVGMVLGKALLGAARALVRRAQG